MVVLIITMASYEHIGIGFKIKAQNHKGKS